MDKATRTLIERIHRAGCRFVLVVSGGGSRAISDLLSVPGGSGSLIEAMVPYSNAALRDWLGATPDQFCSERTARAMATVAYERARALASRDDPKELAGIGCTASLVSDRPKRGPHRVHVAWQSSGQTVVESLELTKGARDRSGEEQVAASMILDAIATAVSSRQEAADPIARPDDCLPDEHRVRRARTAPPEWTELLLGDRDVAYHVPATQSEPNRVLSTERDDAHRSSGAVCPVVPAADQRLVPRLIFPGAFNPFHDGHRRMAAIAAKRVGEPVWFELSITNVDKPPLDFLEMADRLESIADCPMLLTRASRFTDKAALFPSATFVVGADTIERIADPRYDGDDASRAAAAIRRIASERCRFLVFGREIRGRFIVLDDLELPAELRELCDGIAEIEFREDLSSTALRAKAAGKTAAVRKAAEPRPGPERPKGGPCRGPEA